VGAAVGVYDDALARLEELLQEDVDVIVIDTAHADTKSVIETLKMIKKSYSIDVVVGNISEAASCKRLVEAGADGIKVGQGPGSICTTRIVAGIGSPQASAVYNCVMAAGDCPVNADGGIVYTGDVPVAIGCGAESVMMGKVLAGTKEAPGDVVFYKGKQWKMYRGMGSLSAMKDNPGSRERYNQSGKSPLVPEGIEGLVEYAGEVAAVIAQYIGGLRKGMGYVGAATIKEMREKGDFCRITQAGKDESHPHDVEITRDAPNYAAKSNQPEK
jgi:IMP dehydrogenase